MFGIAFIIVGVIVLLQTLGVFGTLSGGIIWGTAFVLIGILMMFRQSMRHKRRTEWLGKHHEKRHDISRGESDQGEA
jgi:hypothetical protein